MAVRTERDPAQTRAALTEWLRTKLGSRDVELIDLPGAQFSGFSNETLLFDVALQERSFGIAVRLEPSGHQVFPDTAFDLQVRVIRSLEDTAVRVPKILWHEPDRALLGSAFFVMERV